jgi:hypothetical protein
MPPTDDDIRHKKFETVVGAVVATVIAAYIGIAWNILAWYNPSWSFYSLLEW